MGLGPLPVGSRPIDGEEVIEPQKPMRTGARLRVVPSDRKEALTALQLLLPSFPGGAWAEWGRMGVHARTLTNELCCLHNRVLLETPSMTTEGHRLLGLVARAWQTRVKQALGPVERWSRSKTLKHMVQRHGAALYVPAAASLEQDPLNDMDTRVSMFIKIEKLYVQPGASMKTPRAIQFRGPRYNLCLARYLLPIEEALYDRLHTEGIGGLYTSKGLTPQGRAELLLELWGKYSSPMALCVDASRFDAHVSIAHLKIEHGFYTMFYPKDRQLYWLLKHQLRNRGTGHFGTKYKLPGGRMSGDVNTALGNTLIQLMVLKTTCGDRPVSIIAEGDDAVVLGEARHIKALAGLVPGRALELGFELKTATAMWPEELEYCSSRPVELQPGKWVSCREWPKPLLSDCLSCRTVAGTKAVAQKGRTMAVCYALQYSGIPVYWMWARRMLSHTVGGELDPWYDRAMWTQTVLHLREECSLEPEEPSLTARASFALAFGIEPSVQFALERMLADDLGNHPTKILGVELRQLRSAAAQLRA